MLKRIVKLTIAVFFGAGDWLWNRIRRLTGQPAQRTCLVIYCHSTPLPLIGNRYVMDSED